MPTVDRAPGLGVLRGSTGCCDHVRAVWARHIDGLGHGGVRYGGALFQSTPSPWADVILLSLFNVKGLAKQNITEYLS